MLTSYEVNLLPAGDNEAIPPIVLDDVEMGFNQMGWLIFTDEQRETVVMFMPTTVRFVARIDKEDKRAFIFTPEAEVN